MSGVHDQIVNLMSGGAAVGGSNGLPIQAAGYGTVGDGLKAVTTAGTRVVLASSTTCKCVIIWAQDTNSKPVTVGGVTVVGAAGATRRGLPIYPGQSSIFYVSNLNLLYLDSEVNGEAVTYAYFN